jgi:hypothetical protein
MFYIVGVLGGKKYRSKGFKSENEAIVAGYKKVYKKDGNTKRKSGLENWHVEANGRKKFASQYLIFYKIMNRFLEYRIVVLANSPNEAFRKFYKTHKNATITATITKPYKGA